MAEFVFALALQIARHADEKVDAALLEVFEFGLDGNQGADRQGLPFRDQQSLP